MNQKSIFECALITELLYFISRWIMMNVIAVQSDSRKKHYSTARSWMDFVQKIQQIEFRELLKANNFVNLQNWINIFPITRPQFTWRVWCFWNKLIFIAQNLRHSPCPKSSHDFNLIIKVGDGEKIFWHLKQFPTCCTLIYARKSEEREHSVKGFCERSRF